MTHTPVVPSSFTKTSYGRPKVTSIAASAYLKTKQQLGMFIEHQIALGNFTRTCPNPTDLGRVILKHARKLMIREGARPHAAVLVAGCDILGFYSSDQARSHVQKLFSNSVPNFSL